MPHDVTLAFYDRNAGRLAVGYEGLSAEAVWGPLLDFVPDGAGLLALDVGAGTGRDTAWLASRGCRP